MATTTNMLLDLPEVGTTSVSTAAANIVTAFETLDAHDHSSGNGVKITPAGININAELEMNSNNLSEVNSVSLDSLTSALSGAANSNRVNVANGELYFTDGNGTAVQVTANGGLDTTTSGGWAGDYSSTDAEASYVSATQTFRLLQDGNQNQAGKLDIGDIKLRTTTAGIGYYVTIKSPALSSSWTLTLPTAAPGSTSLVTMDSTGVLATSLTPTVTTINGVDPTSLASRFITGGADQIDGDKLDIDWAPGYYTPALATSFSTDLDHLTSHLKGIDSALSTIAGGGGTDHGTLAGLTDDDHAQYLLVAGTRAMTGSLNMGTNSITGVTSLAASTSVTVGTTLGVTGASTLAGLSATTGTFSSTLGVTGASTLAALSATTGTFSSTLGVTGTSTLAAMTATTGSFSSTLGVTGASTLAALSATTGTFSSTLGVTGASTLAAVTATTGTFSGLITANGGVTCGTGDDITLVGTGELKHGSRTLNISAAAFGTVTSGYATGTTTPMQANIPLHVGDRILSIDYSVYSTTAGSKYVKFESVDISTQTSYINESATITSTAGLITGTITVSPNITLTADLVAFANWLPVNTADRIYGVTVTYDHP